MRTLITLLCLCSFVSAVEYHTIHIKDGNRKWQNGRGRWVHQFANPSPSDRFGQPNSHFPWLNPGGVPGNTKWRGLETVITYKIPKGEKIEQWRGRGYLPRNYSAPNSLLRQKFPKGTIAEVALIFDGHKFATHTSTKNRDDGKDKRGVAVGIGNWDGEHDEFEPVPTWYQPPSDCRECHKDVAKHGALVHPEKREYYGFVRGSDGRFSAPQAYIELEKLLREIKSELKQPVR